MMKKHLTLKEHATRLRHHYLPLIEQHSTTFRAVDWGSQGSQMARFRLLLEVADWHQASILDVGCGLGHLVDYLASQGFQGRYLGLDTLPEMVAIARSRHPAWQFQAGEIMPLNEPRADYVLGSGLFTFSNHDYMQQTIAAMFGACQKAVAFNSLSAWAEQELKEPGELYADPLTILEFCRTLTPYVVLRHDYMPHDFTIYMYKEQQTQ